MKRPFGPYILRPEEVIQNHIRIGEGPSQIQEVCQGALLAQKVWKFLVIKKEAERVGSLTSQRFFKSSYVIFVWTSAIKHVDPIWAKQLF